MKAIFTQVRHLSHPGREHGSLTCHMTQFEQSDWLRSENFINIMIDYWEQYVTLTIDLTHDLDLGCFKVKFRNSCISGIVGLIDVKWKRSELIWYWAECMTLPFDHSHDLDLGVEISRSESEIALSQEWDGPLTWNEKDVSHPLVTMILTSVTMVGWADVPDSDWGDFRCRRAVDISSSVMCYDDNVYHDKNNCWIVNTYYKVCHTNFKTHQPETRMKIMV